MTVIDRPDIDCLLGVRAGTMSEVVASAPTLPIKQAVNLADLYRKAKARGVLTPFTNYPIV